MIGCVSQGKKSSRRDDSPPPEPEKTPESTDKDLSRDCLPALDWKEAIYGTRNTADLAEIFTNPQSQKSHMLLKRARENSLV